LDTEAATKPTSKDGGGGQMAQMGVTATPQARWQLNWIGGGEPI